IKELRSNVDKLLESNHELQAAINEGGPDKDFEEVRALSFQTTNLTSGKAIEENKMAIRRRLLMIKELQEQVRAMSGGLEGHYL
ncbi:hypothetical protein HDU97_004573, partial [Phlyctochytrium planicorne]